VVVVKFVSLFGHGGESTNILNGVGECHSLPKKNKICSWAANRRISRNGWRVTTKKFGSWARP
jgi:hypothetical protein